MYIAARHSAWNNDHMSRAQAWINDLVNGLMKTGLRYIHPYLKISSFHSLLTHYYYTLFSPLRSGPSHICTGAPLYCSLLCIALTLRPRWCERVGRLEGSRVGLEGQFLRKSLCNRWSAMNGHRYNRRLCQMKSICRLILPQLAPRWTLAGYV
jgi:hypothetical protein